MPANTQPIFGLTPNLGTARITTTYAQVKSDGTSAGSGADFMVKAFTAGANGSYVEKIRFFSVASAAATTGVATTLRAYVSTVSSPGATTNSDTYLVGEVSAGAQSSSHSTNATNFVEIPLNMVIPTGKYIHVSQHVAQTTNQAWNAIVFGTDY
jgi:hypothetical protein